MISPPDFITQIVYESHLKTLPTASAMTLCGNDPILPLEYYCRHHRKEKDLLVSLSLLYILTGFQDLILCIIIVCIL